jgi:hypothetical protein
MYLLKTLPKGQRGFSELKNQQVKNNISDEEIEYIIGNLYE